MKTKKKSTPKPMPKVWGREPRISSGLGVGEWNASATVENGDSVLVLYSLHHPTAQSALRAIRSLWRETFGGGK